MHLLLALAAALTSPAPASDTAAITVPAKNCPRTTSHYAGNESMYGGKQLKERKLAELPPANVYASVLRMAGGCEVPLIIQYNIGAPRR